MIEDVVELVIKARALARNLVARIELANHFDLAFIDAFRFDDPTVWALSSLGFGATDFRVFFRPLPAFSSDGTRCKDWENIGGEQPWIEVAMVDDNAYYAGSKWHAGRWQLLFTRVSVGPGNFEDNTPAIATALLSEALQLCSDFSRASGIGWEESFDIAQAKLSSEPSCATRIEERIRPLTLSKEGCRLAEALQALPHLTSMGGWIDQHFDDWSGFELCTSKLANAKCRALEALTNSTFEDVPLLSDDLRDQIRFWYIDKLSKLN